MTTVMLAHETHGSGLPLVLVHAYPLSRAIWRPVAARLAGAARLVMPDLRGFGASPGGPQPAAFSDYGDDLVALLDRLGLARVVLAGVSFGGYIALDLLRRHPGRLAGLVLSNTRATADAPAAAAARAQQATLAETHGATAVADQMLPRLLRPDAPDDLRRMVHQIIAANDPAAIAAATRAMAVRPDATGLLGQITVPTLVIGATDDPLIAPADTLALHRAIPDSTLLISRAAGHLSCLEQPAGWCAAVAALLRRVAAG
jgi:pimeloyl-ACP methyl ester carboxylesterase